MSSPGNNSPNNGSSEPGGDPDEMATYYVTNRPWECYVREGQPLLHHPYMKSIPNQENAHHWCFKVFRAYKREGPGRVRVQVNNTVFYGLKEKENNQNLTLFYVCVKEGQQWWILAPNTDEQAKAATSRELWGYRVLYDFYATIPMWSCAHCSFQK